MQNKFYKKTVSFLSLTLFFLISFNIYYFFVRHDTISLISRHLSSRTIDPILSLAIYKDLVEEYKSLNSSYLEDAYTVFIGDSITKRFNTEEYFKNERVLNRGIFWDTTYGLMQRLDDNANNINIRKLFIMIGYNDLKYRDNLTIVANIKKIADASKADTVFIQSILPVDSKRQEDNRRIETINKALSRSSETCNYIFINLSNKFKTSNGGIDPKLTIDGVHPNHLGYELWRSIIVKYLF